jgi:hypothetical protein
MTAASSHAASTTWPVAAATTRCRAKNYGKNSTTARRALPREDIMPLFERLETLEKAADIRAVTRLLVKRLPPGAVTAAAKPSAAQGKGNTLLETSWVP